MRIIYLLGFISIAAVLITCNNTPLPVNYGSNAGKRITILNTKIYYEEYGKGMPLVLLSGGGMDRSVKDFSKCIPELSQHYRVILPDTPGQGRFEQCDSLTYQALTEFMSTFLDSLKLDSTYVMGWSDGAITGILLADKRSDKVKKVIAVGANNGLRGAALPPGIPVDSVKPPTLKWWEENNKNVIHDYEQLLPRDWKRYVRNLNAMVYQNVYFSDSVYQRIHIPVMIVLGDRDMISIEHGLEMHRMIRGSEYCVLPNTTHEVFSERPDVINKLAIDFFGK